jgi:hypothetical protein
MTLSANTAVTQAIPANASFVLISASQNVDVMVCLGGVPGGLAANTAATSPASISNLANGTCLGELNPLLRQLGGATTISVCAANTCEVTLAYYN